MSGWLALKSSTTCFSTGCWIGSSPVPRQQNHLMVTFSPVPALPDGSPPVELELEVPPQAARTSPRLTRTAPRRGMFLRMTCPPSRIGTRDNPLSSVSSSARLLSPLHRLLVSAGAHQAGRRDERRVGFVLPTVARHSAFKEVAASVAADKAARRLHRRTVLRVSDPLDLQCQRPRRIAEQP